MNEVTDRRIEHRLQLHVAALATLSGVLVDVSQNRLLLAVVLLVTSAAAIHFTDRRGIFHLPSWVVGIITLGVILPLYANFFESTTTDQLLAISHLLTIWIAVMFFQRKTPRVYGSLIVLSLLMVVVAAVLSGGPLFGALLLAYVFIGLSALCLLFVHREELAMQRAAYLGTQREASLYATDQSLAQFLRGHDPIAYQLPTRGGVTSLWVSGLSWQVLGLGLVTLMFAIGFFLFIPRLGQGEWSQQRPGSQTKVGFSSQVTFEEMGEILEGNKLAMRVTFYEDEDDEAYPIFGDVYFSGQALVTYHVNEQGQAAWHPYEMANEGRPLRRPRTMPPGELVRQEILMEPSEEPTVFSASPPFPVPNGRAPILVDRYYSRLFRSENTNEQSKKQFRYELNTTAFRNGSQVPLIPYMRRVPESREPVNVISPEERAVLTHINRTRFPRLIEIAERIARESEDPENPILVMRRLQSHFMSDVGFVYTLDMRKINAARNPELDPVEDFVANYRMGHCKYYASALTLMLRSLGIPARLVVGYHGGEFNRLGGYYQVYERDAHAWVEAYLAPDEVPEGMYGQDMTHGGGAWYRLDPTPGRSDPAPLSREVLRVVDQMLDFVQLLWTNYVLNMNPERQTDAGFDVLAEEGSEYVANIRVIRQGIERLRGLFDPDQPEEDGQAGTRARGPLMTFALLLGLVFVGGVAFSVKRILQRRGRRRAERRKQGPSSDRARLSVEFYARLEELLGHLGHRREPTQTQREFIHAIDGRLAHPPVDPTTLLPETIVELYYRVRFGQQPLAGDEPQRINTSLDRLETVVREAREK